MVRSVWILSAVLLCGLVGCGSGSFVPPRPPELEALPDPSKAESKGTVAMVLAPGDTIDQFVWASTVRKHVNRAKSGFIISRPEVGDPPSRQAKLIRDAVGPGVVALVVEPMDDPEVTAVLNEVRATGLPVVLLNHSVPNSDPSKPFSLVSYAPAESVYRQLAEAARFNANKSLGLPDDGTALVLSDAVAPVDPQGRVPEIIEAFKKAGVAKVESFRIDRDADKARAAIEARIEADPKVTILVGTEDNALRIALVVKHAMPAGRAMSVVGCASWDGRPDAAINTAAALVDLNVPDLAKEAALLALKLARGEKVAPEVLIPVTFHRQPEYAPAPSRSPVSTTPEP